MANRPGEASAGGRANPGEQSQTPSLKRAQEEDTEGRDKKRVKGSEDSEGEEEDLLLTSFVQRPTAGASKMPAVAHGSQGRGKREISGVQGNSTSSQRLVREGGEVAMGAAASAGEEAVATGEEAEYDIDLCHICQAEGEVLCCDGCPRVYHMKCLRPPMASVPEGDWFCPSCVSLHPRGASGGPFWRPLLPWEPALWPWAKVQAPAAPNRGPCLAAY